MESERDSFGVAVGYGLKIERKRKFRDQRKRTSPGIYIANGKLVRLNRIWLMLLSHTVDEQLSPHHPISHAQPVKPVLRLAQYISAPCDHSQGPSEPPAERAYTALKIDAPQDHLISRALSHPRNKQFRNLLLINKVPIFCQLGIP